MAIDDRAIATFVGASLFLAASAFDGVSSAEIPRNFTTALDTPTMRMAIAQARETLPVFLRMSADKLPGTDHFAIKYGIPTQCGIEYIWANVRAVDGALVTARVDVDVHWSMSIRDGNEVTVDTAEIIDWIYIDDGRMRGNATLCALEADQPSAERAAVIARFGLDCSWLTSLRAESAPREAD